jgi:hypothetical protein
MAIRKRADAVDTGQTSPLFRDPPGIEHVLTVPELAEQGLARVVAYTEKGVPTHYSIDTAGVELITAAMKRNADRRRNAEPR